MSDKPEMHIYKHKKPTCSQIKHAPMKTKLVTDSKHNENP